MSKVGNKLVFFNLSSTFILYSIAFISAPLFSRLLGSNDYGIVQVFLSWTSIIQIVLSLGTVGTLSIAKVNIPSVEYKNYYSSVYFLSVFVFIGGGVIFIIFSHLYPISIHLNGIIPTLIVFNGLCVFSLYFVNAVLTYELKAKYNLIISVLVSSLNLILSFLFIRYLFDTDLYMGRILGLLLPNIFAFIVITLYIYLKGQTIVCFKYWKYCLPLSIPLVFHGLSGVVTITCDKFMLQHFLSFSAVGIYALACNFANIMNSIWCALNNSFTPIYINYFKNKDANNLLISSKRYLVVFTLLCLGFILLSPEVFYLFAPKEFYRGVNLIPIIVISNYFIFIYSYYGNLEFCYAKTKMLAIGSSISCVANVIFNYFLINHFQIIGAAISTMLSSIILAFIHYLFAKSISDKKFFFGIKNFFVFLLLLLVVSILFYCLIDIFYVRFIIATFVAVILLRYLFKNKSIF